MEYPGEEPRTEYPQDVEFVCGICGREFETREELERHVNDAGLLY
jgi:uncharacterized C2H2 Zn-finger protein